MDVEVKDGRTKRIRIRRAHLEEDTAKLTHLEGASKDYSLADYNRSSVPLLEIVTEPDIESVEEAVAYGTKIRSILRYLGVNTGDMEKGVLRFEANISIRPKGTTELNTRTEIKNLNSFGTLEAASTREIARQIEMVRAGKTIRQSTLGWDADRADVYSMRRKEDAHDYRYFPEPDLPPFKVARALVEQVRAALPELAEAKLARFQSELGLSAYDAGVLSVDRPVAEYFEAAVKAFGGSPKTIANWMIGEVFRLLKDRDVIATGDIADVKTTPEQLAALVKLVEGKKVNANSAKDVFKDVIVTGEDPAAVIRAKGLEVVSDTGEIGTIIAGVLAANQTQVQQYLGGKEAVFNFLLGQVMKATRGKASTDVARQVLTEQLAAMKR